MASYREPRFERDYEPEAEHLEYPEPATLEDYDEMSLQERLEAVSDAATILRELNRESVAEYAGDLRDLMESGNANQQDALAARAMVGVAAWTANWNYPADRIRALDDLTSALERRADLAEDLTNCRNAIATQYRQPDQFAESRRTVQDMSFAMPRDVMNDVAAHLEEGRLAAPDLRRAEFVAELRQLADEYRLVASNHPDAPPGLALEAPMNSESRAIGLLYEVEIANFTGLNPYTAYGYQSDDGGPETLGTPETTGWSNDEPITESAEAGFAP